MSKSYRSPHMTVTYIRLPDDLRLAAERIAIRDDCALHAVLRKAIRRGLGMEMQPAQTLSPPAELQPQEILVDGIDKRV